MDNTSLSLIARCRQSSDNDGWNRIVALYKPLLRRWLSAYEVQDADADDLIQEVLAVVARELSTFDHNQRDGAFRNWLRRILINRLREHWRQRDRAQAPTGGTDLLRQLNELEDPHSCQSRIWNQEHDRHLTQQLLAMVEPQFTESTRAAFRQLVLEGNSPEEVAADLGISLSAVFTAKSRVLRELRRIGAGLIE